ncbi:hypothetical protein VTH06DRAFT_7183 [Thermothelomyces fergusii]
MSGRDHAANTSRLHMLAAVASQEAPPAARGPRRHGCLLILAEAASRVLAGTSSEKRSDATKQEQAGDGARDASATPRTAESGCDGGSSNESSSDEADGPEAGRRRPGSRRRAAGGVPDRSAKREESPEGGGGMAAGE